MSEYRWINLLFLEKVKTAKATYIACSTCRKQIKLDNAFAHRSKRQQKKKKKKKKDSHSRNKRTFLVGESIFFSEVFLKCKLMITRNWFIAKILQSLNNICFEVIQSGIKSECFRLEQNSVIKCLVAEKSKPYKIFERMCVVNEEVWYIKKCSPMRKKHELAVTSLCRKEKLWSENILTLCEWKIAGLSGSKNRLSWWYSWTWRNPSLSISLKVGNWKRWKFFTLIERPSYFPQNQHESKKLYHRWECWIFSSLILITISNNKYDDKKTISTMQLIAPLNLLCLFQSYILDASGRSSVMHCLHCRFRVISASYRLRQ